MSLVEPHLAPEGTFQRTADSRPSTWIAILNAMHHPTGAAEAAPVFVLARLYKLAPVVLAGLLLAACGQQNTFVAPPPPKVMVAKPVMKPAVQYVEATGNTAPLMSVDLEARVQGFLEKINYKDGAAVKGGTLLFEIQRDTYEAQLAQAQASLEFRPGRCRQCRHPISTPAHLGTPGQPRQYAKADR